MQGLTGALELLGRDAETRAAMVAALQAYEQLPQVRFTNVREEVTGAVVDALYRDAGILRKTLRNGLTFEFLYKSKIARDFVMAQPELPDHVWEPQTTRLLLHLCSGGGDAIVGGAYFGDQAIPMAHALGQRGTCHAFEPDPVQAAMLGRNAERNGLGNLRVQPIGLWSDADVRLGFVGEDAIASTLPAADGIVATTIDAYVREAAIERVSLIMLDLEGAELAVLRGAEAVLRAHAPHIVYEVHRSYVDWSAGLRNTEIVRFLGDLGYTQFAVRDFQSNVDMGERPIELVPLETAWLEGPPHGFNLVAVQDAAVLAGGRFRIVPGVSPKLLRHRDPSLHHPTGGL